MKLGPYATTAQRAAKYGLQFFGFLFCIFLVGPIFIFVPLSFNDVALFHYPVERFSTRWFQELVTSREWSHALLNSVFVAVSSTVLATALGVCAAFGLWRGDFRGKELVLVIFMLPLIVPTVISAVSMYFAFASVSLDGSYLGLIIAHTALATPMVVVSVSAVLAGLDRNLLRAAASLGAHPLLVFFRVTLPLIQPGVMAGAIFAFAISFDDVVAALFLAGPRQQTLPLQMYMRATDLFDLVIAAAATFMLVVAIGLMSLLLFLQADRTPVRKANEAMREVR
jgi:putative spermidine/putrescine transport system permease protein